MSGVLAQTFYRLFAATTTQCPYGGNSCDTGLPKVGATSGNLQSAIQVVIGIAGAIAVVMIVIGGLQFITAQGDPSGVAKARKTLVFALVGLIVAILAEAIVTFVVSKL
jgi:hypothetical protein